VKVPKQYEPVHIFLSSSEELYTGVADQIKKPPGRRTRFNSTSSIPPVSAAPTKKIVQIDKELWHIAAFYLTIHT